MTSLKILAAAMLVAVSAPAFASDGSESVPSRTYEFLQQTRGDAVRVIEGRNSAPVVDKVQAAIAQGFAPVDTTSDRSAR